MKKENKPDSAMEASSIRLQWENQGLIPGSVDKGRPWALEVDNWGRSLSAATDGVVSAALSLCFYSVL